MFGLRQQVSRDERRIRSCVRNDHDLRGTGWHIDGDAPIAVRNDVFGCRDPGIARSENLVDRGNCFGAVRHRGNRLRAANFVYLVNTALQCGIDSCGMDAPVAKRRRAYNTNRASRDGSLAHQA